MTMPSSTWTSKGADDGDDDGDDVADGGSSCGLFRKEEDVGLCAEARVVELSLT